MKKSKLMLPLALLILASCGGNTSSGTPATSTPASETPASETPASETSTEPGSETSTEPAGPGTPAPDAGDTSSIQYLRTIGEALDAGTATAEDYTATGTVTSILNRNFTIQQGDYALYVYQNVNLPTGFEVGKKVTVTGKIADYNGLIQISNGGNSANTVTITVDGDGDTITPLEITAYDETRVELSSRLVKIPNLTYVSGSHTTGEHSNINFKQVNTEVVMRVDRNLDNTIEDAIALKLSGFVANTTVITYEGVLGYFNKLQLSITSADNMVVPSAS